MKKKIIIISIIGITILALIILLVNNKKTKVQIIEEPKKEPNIVSDFNEQNNQFGI